MQVENLSCVEISPQSPVRYTVLWMHGLGANGHDFEPIVPHLDLLDEWGVRFVFPHAPSIPVTLNGGWVMPAWFDVFELGGQGREDEAGIERAAAQISALMDREIQSLTGPERLILAGFSQGGAVALHLAARYAAPLAGVIALSTYVVLPDRFEREASEAAKSLRAFVGHGTLDPMVPIRGGIAAANHLRNLGVNVTWKSYPMQHEVCPSEISDIGSWLRDIVSP